MTKTKEEKNLDKKTLLQLWMAVLLHSNHFKLSAIFQESLRGKKEFDLGKPTKVWFAKTIGGFKTQNPDNRKIPL